MYFVKVIRQQEPMLVRAINNLCKGVVTDETDAFLKSLQRPLPPSSTKSTKLCATVFQTDCNNNESLADMEIDGRSYPAQDKTLLSGSLFT